jgi:hypothetical protein
MHTPSPFTFSSTMDTSQLFLDPDFWLDTPSLSHVPDVMGMEYPISLNVPEQLGRKRKTRVRASRACIACRSRHTKCDGVEPVCTKCQVEEKTCVYTKSRRGGSGRSLATQAILGLGKLNETEKAGGSTNSSNPISHINHATPLSTPRSANFPTFPHNSSSSEETIALASEVTEDGSFISRYFELFHNAPPIVLPHRKFLERIQSDSDSLEYLLPVLKYIGALYTPGTQTDILRQFAHDRLSCADIPSNGFTVQALLLFAVAIHCSDEYKAAESYLDKAIDIALAINMNTEAFAWDNAESEAVLAESWKRTWWTLYCVDAMFAAISHYPSHRLQNLIGNVSLPCEDKAYYSGVGPPLPLSIPLFL